MTLDVPDYVRTEHNAFLQASRDALGNAQLRAILSRLSDTLAARNRQAWLELPNSEAIRRQARRIKDETLADLDRHLSTLAANVERHGGQVHWAADADEARRIIVELVRGRQATKVVKAKSMTTEEIHLNRALAAAGIEVVETDLGEYIIQLAGHRPSHIVGPALHLSLDDVREILSRRAAQPLARDRHQLAAFARQQLRQRFADAEVAITGVNFAVADTGTIVLVSNEGNARLATTLPPVHIAVMGIEKVVPRWRDLPYFLNILARAATGQKLSVYTSLLTGPRRAGELDGAREFHLVILDNGRTRILAGPLRESLFCIRCGACLNACPVYRNIGGHAYGGVYSGPIGAVLTPLQSGLSAHRHLPHASSLCGACQAACPVKIAIPEMLITLRHQLQRQPGAVAWTEKFAYRMWAVVIRHPLLYRFFTWLISRTIGCWRRSRWIGSLPGKLGGWTQTRDFPAPAGQRFRDWWSKQP